MPRHVARQLPSQVPSFQHLRNLLPAGAYLRILHEAVTTGFIPRFTQTGERTGQFDNMAPKDRIDLARYLLDKVLPDAPKEVNVTQSLALEEVTEVAVRNLSLAELRALAAASTASASPPENLTEPLPQAAPLPT